mgnify:CR=1 FL=1
MTTTSKQIENNIQYVKEKNLDKLITTNYYFITKQINNYKWTGFTDKELKALAHEGLWLALEGWDEAKGSFWMYAKLWIKKTINIYITDNLSTVRIPGHMQKERDLFPTQNMISLDTSTYEDGEPLYSLIPYEEDYIEDEWADFKVLLRRYLPTMKEKDQELIRMRYIEDMRLEDIGTVVSTSKEAVRLRLKTIIKRMKKDLLK